MNIEQVSVTFPSQVVTNADVIAEIAAASHDTPGIRRLLGRVSVGLERTGAETRRVCAPNETTLGLTLEACRKAMAGLPDDGKTIDLVVYAGVYQELMEPASSNLIAHELGLDHAECFDIKEACDGWMKATKIAYLGIRAGFYKRVMVVNAEFSQTRGYPIRPKLYKLTSLEELEYRFPTYTVGEAVAVTILGPHTVGDGRWSFFNQTRNDLYDLCTMTPSWYGAYPIPSARVAKDGPGCFTSYGSDLYRNGFPLSIDTWEKSGLKASEVDAFFTHSSSKRDWTQVAEKLLLTNVFHDIYAEYGNVVSAAIPAAMALAVEQGTLKRGDRVAALVASAGMSFSTAHFTF